MIIDLTKSFIHLPTIQSMLDNREYDTPTDLLSDMAEATQCHVVVCLHYMAHLTSMTPDIERILKLCYDFYKIEGVSGWPLNVPKQN